MLKHLFTFRGNIGRLEYAINLLFALILFAIPFIITSILSRPDSDTVAVYTFIFKGIYFLASYSLISSTVRRWRDLGISLWWMVTLFIPYVGMGATLMLLFASGWSHKNSGIHLFTLLKILAESDGEVNAKETVLFEEFCQANMDNEYLIRIAKSQFVNGTNNPWFSFEYHLKQLEKEMRKNPDSFDPQWVVALLVAIAEADGTVSKIETRLINMTITKFGLEEMLPLGFEELMGMLAKLAKADGVIAKEEVAVIDHFLKFEIQLNENQRKQAISQFQKAKNSDDTFGQLAQKFAEIHQGNQDLLELTFELLIQVALADEVVSDEESALLDQAGKIFNIEKSQNHSNNTSGSRKSQHLKNEAYYADILNLDSVYNLADVRKRYKLLVAKNHPDKVANLSEVIRMAAENETKKINEAYVYFKDKYAA